MIVIKGLNKNAVLIKKPNSPLIDEIFLVLKDDKGGYDLMDEVNRVVSDALAMSGKQRKNRMQRVRALLMGLAVFLLGVIVGMLFCLCFL